MEKERKDNPLSQRVRELGAEPALKEMKRRTLREKGIEGPTSAHVIEEIHTPLNIACVTFSTGTSAFQNPVCITYPELETRVMAGKKALELAGVKRGDRILITYPPLLNVFTRQALEEAGIFAGFLYRSNRDACLAALCEENYQAVIGESSFLKSTFEMITVLGLEEQINWNMIVIGSGSPLNRGLAETMEEAGISRQRLHDLYGCQEFGWISLDGIPVRDDVYFLEWKGKRHVFVGGLSVGDCFPLCEKRHILNPKGDLLSGDLSRSEAEWETVLCQTALPDRETAVRAARTILRLKSKVVRVATDLHTRCPCSSVRVCPVWGEKRLEQIFYSGSTRMMDDLLEAQIQYQRNKKNDSVWKKW